VHEPSKSLPAMLYPVGLTKLAVHRGHRIGEFRDRLPDVTALEVGEHLMAVLDSGHLPQRLIEQARHAIVGMPLAHCCDDVAQPQIVEAVRRRIDVWCRAAAREQDTRQLFTAISDVGYPTSGNVAAPPWTTVPTSSPE
jgi:uncharacterized membrane-anchored protein